ncbi:hypothetical protein K431DRAFT_233082 [Polychaeton citri CBS 116435]|uniref:Uncharacterized protein n=1 Tax=Polychaeton citri CBS 116435 TaxID=1314669 RepID=A0A9P4Q0Y7_9PEZI|nr:hypothetical protein K431DRAFT_233082 [Polychaeton citri CBS 116435]
MSPDAETPSTLHRSSRSNSDASRPPPYSEHAFTSSTSNGSQSLTPSTSNATASPSVRPITSSADAPASRHASTSGSDNISIITRGSKGTQALRIKTSGSSLSSGFSYHPALFDLQVRPDEWERFTYQVVECTKLGIGDQAKMWSAATATALTGAIGTSIWVGRTMNRTLQEKRVKSAMLDMNDGGLGDTLQRWNDKYFKEKGLFAHLELSEHAMKNPEQKSKTVRMHHSLNISREERKKVKEERKFVIVISKLDDEGVPSEAVHELADDGVQRAELDTPSSTNIAELDNTGFDSSRPLSVTVAGDIKRDLAEIPEGYAELPATDIAEIDSTPIEKPDLENGRVSADTNTLQPPPLFGTPPVYTDKDKD